MFFEASQILIKIRRISTPRTPPPTHPLSARHLFCTAPNVYQIEKRFALMYRQIKNKKLFSVQSLAILGVGAWWWEVSA